MDLKDLKVGEPVVLKRSRAEWRHLARVAFARLKRLRKLEGPQFLIKREQLLIWKRRREAQGIETVIDHPVWWPKVTPEEEEAARQEYLANLTPEERAEDEATDHEIEEMFKKDSEKMLQREIEAARGKRRH